MIASSIAALSLIIWLFLIAARGRIWRVTLPNVPTAASAPTPRIAVIVPARNEADFITQTIQ